MTQHEARIRQWQKCEGRAQLIRAIPYGNKIFYYQVTNVVI